MTAPDTAALRAMADAAQVAGFPIGMYPDSVRALCDAADEVERLRTAEARPDLDWLIEDFTPESWRFLAETFMTQRDASRTAHVALVADLRALCGPGAPDHLRAVSGDVRALLDRHAPEEKP